MLVEALQSAFRPHNNVLQSSDIVMKRKAIIQGKTAHKSNANFKGMKVFLCRWPLDILVAFPLSPGLPCIPNQRLQDGAPAIQTHLSAKSTPAQSSYISVVYCHNQVDVRIGKQSFKRNFNAPFYKKKKCSNRKFLLPWVQKKFKVGDIQPKVPIVSRRYIENKSLIVEVNRDKYPDLHNDIKTNRRPCWAIVKLKLKLLNILYS